MNCEQKENHELFFYKAVDGEFRFNKRVYLQLEKREKVINELKCGRFGLSNEVYFFTSYYEHSRYNSKIYLNIIPEGEYQAERILIEDHDLILSINDDDTDPSSFQLISYSDSGKLKRMIVYNHYRKRHTDDEKEINNCAFLDVEKKKTFLKIEGPNRLLYLWQKDQTGLATCLFDNEIGWKINFAEIEEDGYKELSTPTEENKQESEHHKFFKQEEIKTKNALEVVDVKTKNSSDLRIAVYDSGENLRII